MPGLGPASTTMPEDTEGATGAGIASSIDKYFTEQAKAGDGGDQASGDTPQADDQADGTAAATKKAEGKDDQSAASDGTDGGGLGVYADIELDLKPFEAISDPDQRKAVTDGVQRRFREQMEGLARKDAQRQEEHQALIEGNRDQLNVLNHIMNPETVERALPDVIEGLARIHEANGVDIYDTLAAILKDRPVRKDVADMDAAELHEHYLAIARREMAKKGAQENRQQQQQQTDQERQAKDTEAWISTEAARIIPLIAKEYNGFTATPEDVKKAAAEYPPADRKAGLYKSLQTYLADKLLKHMTATLPTKQAAEMGDGGGSRPRKGVDTEKLTGANLDFLNFGGTN